MKTIDGRDYCYLRSRERPTATSQYVVPVTLAEGASRPPTDDGF